jgi:thiol-disulfide isomerase/thioredoxin
VRLILIVIIRGVTNVQQLEFHQTLCHRLLLAASLASALVASPAQAAGFAFRNLDGRRVAANDFRGKVVVLAFGASWLPLSRAQVQGVQQLANEFGGRGVEVFWVSTDSEQAKSKNFASDEQLRSLRRKTILRINVLARP